MNEEPVQTQHSVLGLVTSTITSLQFNSGMADSTSPFAAFLHCFSKERARVDQNVALGLFSRTYDQYDFITSYTFQNVAVSK